MVSIILDRSYHANASPSAHFFDQLVFKSYLINKVGINQPMNALRIAGFRMLPSCAARCASATLTCYQAFNTAVMGGTWRNVDLDSSAMFGECVLLLPLPLSVLTLTSAGACVE